MLGKPLVTLILSTVSMLLQPICYAKSNINIEYVQKSVVFLYGPDAAGNAAMPLGTGFIVQVPLKSNPKRADKLLVTARHIVDPQWALCPQSSPPAKIFMRVNTKMFDPDKDSVGTHEFELAGENVAANAWFIVTIMRSISPLWCCKERN